MAVNEFELIATYFSRGGGGEGVSLGIGDDCALLQPPAGKLIAATVDTLVAGNHFPDGADPASIAERALRVNLSDLAAMGAEPRWFTLSLTLPAVDEHWLAGFSRGLFEAARRYHCSLVGGDTTRGPLSITIQAMGVVVAERAMKRGNARPGDTVYVTGPLGDGAAALAVITGQAAASEAGSRYLHDRYYRPVPRLAEGQALAGIASAAIDISDGLLADLGHICTASGVGAVIDLERIPVSPAFRELAGPARYADWILAGGDDYQLCFTVPGERVSQVEQLIQRNTLAASAIGGIVVGEGVSCRHNGQALALNTLALKKGGYQHFDADNI